MHSIRWIVLVAAAGFHDTAHCQVTADRSADMVVLENGLLRVELRRDRNFHPASLIDKRNPQDSLIDSVGFSAWDVRHNDWMNSATCDWLVTVESKQEDQTAWCETTLTRTSPKAGASLLRLRTTVRQASPAVRLDFQVQLRSEHAHTMGLRIQAAGYQRAAWSTPWGTSDLDLIGRKNAFHALLGFRNGLVLTRHKTDPRSGLMLFHNTAWNTVFPILREKPTVVRYLHPTVTSPARCSLTLVPFSRDPDLIGNTRKWGRAEGVQLLTGHPSWKPARRPASVGPTPQQRQRGLVVFPVRPFETVLPDSLPTTKSTGTALQVRACPGETEPASFAVRSLRPLRELIVRAGDLVSGDNKIPAGAIDTHVIKVWRQAGLPTLADVTMGAGQLVPELLLKDDRREWNGSRPSVRLSGPVVTELKTDLTKQFWLTVQVPDHIPAGRYRGQITVSARDVAAVHVPLEVEVLPFALSPSRKRQGIWLLAERRPDQPAYVEPDVYRRLLADIQSHGMQFVTIRGRGMRIAEDVLDIHQSAGMRGLTIWSSWFPSSVDDFGPLRKRLEQATRKHGYQQLYFQAADEPNSDERLARAMAYFDKVKAAGGRTFCNIMPEYAIRLGDRLDVPCVGYANFFGSLERPEPVTEQASDALHQLLETHDDVWYYWQCRVEDPRINRLLFGFLLMKSPATGAMPYTYSTLTATLPFDDWSALRQGQISRAGGGAVYHTRSGSLRTIQWEAAREGVDDARYVSTLETLIREARRKPHLANAADRATQALTAIYAQLPPHLYQTIQHVSPRDLDGLRSGVIAAILELRSAMGK